MLLKIEKQKGKPWSPQPCNVSGWGCCIILYLYRNFVFFHSSCIPTTPRFRSLCLTQTWLKYLMQIKMRAPNRLKAPGLILYFTSSLFVSYFFSVLCQIVNRQMEPFRWRNSSVNIRLVSVDAGVHKSDDHTWNGGSR